MLEVSTSCTLTFHKEHVAGADGGIEDEDYMKLWELNIN
jgi:hypothetical protein